MPQEIAPQSSAREERGPSVADLIKAPSGRAPTPSSQPLYLRLYFQEAFIALTRLIGYESWPIDQAKRKVRALSRKLGEEAVSRACYDLLEVDARQNPPLVRLKAEVRKLAYQMLGAPPQPEADSTESCATTVPPAKNVVMPRNQAIERFERWMNDAGATWIPGSELAKAHPALTLPPPPDALLTQGKRRLLVAINTRLLPRQIARLFAWRAALGEHHEVVRMWPVEAEDGREWRDYPVANFAEITAKRLTIKDWEVVMTHRQKDKQSGLNWKSEHGCHCARCDAARSLA